MPEIANKRCSILVELAADKNRLGLPRHEIELLDQALRDRWGVDFFETKLSLSEYVAEFSSARVQSRFAVAHESASQSLRRGKGEEALYAAMCEPELLGIVTARRRHFLIDSVAMAAALVRAAQITGKVLDVGCHAGIAGDLLSDLIPNEIWGIDPVAEAVETARARLSNRRNLTFLKAGMPWTTGERFELVLAIDSMPKNIGDRAVFLKGIADVLGDGGLALIVSQHWVEADVSVIQRQLKNCRYGHGLADVVGGYGGMPTAFEAEGCLVLVKSASAPVPRKLRLAMENDWDAFREFANDNRTESRHKTQAFKRAVQRV